MADVEPKHVAVLENSNILDLYGAFIS